VRLDLRSLAELPPEEAAACIAAFVEALVSVNALYLKRHPSTPPLYKAGVTYVADEPWKDVPALLDSRKGDCKSLVAWRIAELRAQGYMALVHVVYTARVSDDLFHVQIRRKDKLEDPSRFLGMRT